MLLLLISLLEELNRKRMKPQYVQQVNETAAMRTLSRLTSDYLFRKLQHKEDMDFGTHWTKKVSL